MRRGHLLFLSIVLLFLVSLLFYSGPVSRVYATPSETSDASDAWPMFRHDLNHTGYSTSKAPNTNNVLWSYTLGGEVASSPAVVNGVVYVSSHLEGLYALNVITGELIWSYPMKASLWSSPAIDQGRVFIGSRDNKVYCLNASNGNLIWSYATGGRIDSSPAVADDRVFIGSDDGKIYCLDEYTGTLIWNYTTGSEVYSSPAVTNDRIFVGSDDDTVYCLNVSTGSLLWSTPTDGDVWSSPAVADGRVFVGSLVGDNLGKVYALNDSTGAIVWNYTTGARAPVFTSSPSVADGKVFIGSDSKVYCLNESTGELIWSYTTGGTVWSSPAVADDKVFVGSEDYKLYCLDYDNGSVIWSYTAPRGVRSSPIIADNKVFVGCGSAMWGGRVFAFSDLPTLTVDISLSLSTSTSYVGFKVEINGGLTCNDVGLSGTPILLSYSINNGESWNDITLVNTASDGNYLAEWMPSATGNYLIRASWPGNSTYLGESATVNLAVTPYINQYVFSVLSNSSVSAFAFNSTSRKLSFTVSGPSGTMGYVEVTIAKALVANITDLKVHLDGDQINYTVTSTDDSWLLYFSYHHSIHNVTVSLGPAPSKPPFEPFVMTPTVIIVTCSIIIAGIASVLVILKKKGIIFARANKLKDYRDIRRLQRD